MALSICPGCKQNADRDSDFCSLCGFDFAHDRTAAYNRRITFWLRVSCFACGLVSYIAVRSMGRRPGYRDYRDLLLSECVCAGAIYGALKLMFPGSRRKLGHTALIPSLVILAGVFVWRASQGPDSSSSLNRLMGASPASAGVISTTTAAVATPTVTTPTDPPPAGASTGGRAAAKTPSQSATTPASPTSKDGSAALVPIASECFNFLRRQPGFIVSEVKGAGVEKMLLPASMENAKQLDASRARLHRLGERLADYESRIRKSAADLITRVNASGAGEKTRAKFLADVRRSGGEFVRGVLEFAVLERRSVAATEETLAFLRSRVDKFTVINKRPIFADAADSKKYDGLRKTINDLDARADQLLSNLRAQGERVIRELNPPGGAESAAQARAGNGGGL